MKTSIRYYFLCAILLAGLNIVYAQNIKQDKKAAKIEAIKTMVNNANYIFRANYVNPQRGGNKALTSDYDLKVTKDTITAFLPYYGRAYVAPINPSEGGIKFTSTNFIYTTKNNKAGSWDILIKPKLNSNNDLKDVQQLRLNISSGGYASLSVISTNREPISFNGYIEEIKVKN